VLAAVNSSKRKGI